jgi:hypothetical protein
MDAYAKKLRNKEGYQNNAEITQKHKWSNRRWVMKRFPLLKNYKLPTKECPTQQIIDIYRIVR